MLLARDDDSSFVPSLLVESDRYVSGKSSKVYLTFTSHGAGAFSFAGMIFTVGKGRGRRLEALLHVLCILRRIRGPCAL